MNRIVIGCKGGLIQWILSEEPVKILHLDGDVTEESTRDNAVMNLLDVEGRSFEAESGIYPTDISPDKVKHYFDQVEHQLLAKHGFCDE